MEKAEHQRDITKSYTTEPKVMEKTQQEEKIVAIDKSSICCDFILLVFLICLVAMLVVFAIFLFDPKEPRGPVRGEVEGGIICLFLAALVLYPIIIIFTNIIVVFKLAIRNHQFEIETANKV